MLYINFYKKDLTMAKNNVSLSKIAAESGVSCGLVSTYFSQKTYRNGGDIGISAETELKIIKASRKLGYLPTDLAMRLKLYPDFGCFAFLISDGSKTGFAPFYSELMFGAYDLVASNKNINFSLSGFDENFDYLSNPDEMPFCTKDDHTSKIMMAGTINYSFLLALKQRGCSIVYFLREVNLDGVISIVPDFEEAGYQAVKHLIESGHRDIAVAAEFYFKGLVYNTTLILRGAKRAFDEAEIAFNNEDVFYNQAIDTENHNDCFEQIQATGKKVSAIFCLCDYTALRVMKSIQSAKLNVPEDISIVGCNNQAISANLNPPLSSVDLSLHEMGKCGAEILNAPEKNTKQIHKFPVKLVKRNSVKKLN